ncbi:DHA2 family efflux MFS transporter permease subunit [Paenibacillus sp. NEAU-GSW1]|uniref:DHA2 family efflux MFS transporter permease subunit n=1 Tax=Paenibacillus sp. NEAU-GSW1 TaxID=2682486 RepID=UPI0012E31500|nr:DHA2 family efflux MFS transporter permease subunit [Paenibacillus sp. NEAU-GSW1]MUT66874.1 DHA2 family efflux MFS transporter permease subunit [Paenibacillus sp. NEAU-GSW1]
MSTISREESFKPAASIRELIGPLIAIIVALFMVILDTTAVNVALPVLVKDFGKSLSVVQWTITGYTLAQAAVIPLAGWLSDKYGAKPVLNISLILFIFGSILCALSASVEQLIAFRVLQGLGGGMVVPIAFAMTFRLSPPEKAGSIIGMMGIPILLAPAFGPIVAGYLVDYVNWQWIFLINLPIGVIGVVLCWLLLPRFPKKSSVSLDFWGIVLGPIAFAGLSYGITEGGESWTSARTVIGLTAGAVALILFVIVELTRKKEPLLELRVFKSMPFTRGIFVQWVLQFVMFGLIFMIPYFMQKLMGMSAFEAGLWTLPHALAAATFMPIGGRLYDRIGARPLVIIGLSLVAAGAFLVSRIDATDNIWMFFLPRVLIGSGMGLSYLPINTFLVQSAPANLVSRVTSLTSAAQQVIISLSVAGLTTIIANRTSNHIADGMNPMPEAMTAAFHDTYLVLSVVALAGLILGMTLRRVKVHSAGADEASQQAKSESAMLG